MINIDGELVEVGGTSSDMILDVAKLGFALRMSAKEMPKELAEDMVKDLLTCFAKGIEIAEDCINGKEDFCNFATDFTSSKTINFERRKGKKYGRNI